MALRPVLSDNQRFPAIDDLGYLKSLQQHEYAPVFNFKSGDRLTKTNLGDVLKYGDDISRGGATWKSGEVPEWVNSYMSGCLDSVPFYKGRPELISDNPSIGRDDLRREPWAFVSDRCDPEDLLVYSTSGTTGQPLDVLFNSVTQATYIPQLQSVLNHSDIRIKGGPDSVAIALICSQQETLTYASLSSVLNGAGILKINLNPDDWREPVHRNRFLESVNPEILTGDPFAFRSLMELKPQIYPKAMVSSAMTLLPGLKQQLEACFQCPVIDVYSLTECRMIAFAADGGHLWIRHDLFAEVLEPDRDIPVPPGERGELVLTGGNNPFLNLIRYRTGDFCSIRHEADRIILVDLEGRKPVMFQSETGDFINSVDVSRLMAPFSLPGFRLHQNRDRSLVLTLHSDPSENKEISEKIHDLFGDGIPLSVSCEPEPDRGGKTVTYSSDIGGAS